MTTDTIGMINLIEKVFKGRAPIEQKIACLISTRRDSKDDKVIDTCNLYLTKLYDMKWGK